MKSSTSSSLYPRFPHGGLPKIVSRTSSAVSPSFIPLMLNVAVNLLTI
jgi:hypothetical protein